MDTAAPTFTSISTTITGTGNYTYQNPNTLTLTASDTGSELFDMNFSCDNATFSSTENYAGTKSFNLRTGTACTNADGNKTVYARIRDRAYNVGTANTGTGGNSTYLDTVAPTFTLINISSFTGSTGYTYREKPALSLTASDSQSALYDMNFSCNNTTFSSPTGFASTYSDFNIASGAGCTNADENKTVYSRIRDRAYNVGTANASSFVLDRIKPSTSWDGNHNTWQAFDANIHLTCSDATSGCASTKYSVNNGNWTSFDANVFVSSEGTTSIDFNSTDYANNVGDTNSFTIKIDKTAPATVDNHGAGGQGDQNIQFSCTDSNSGCKLFSYDILDINYYQQWGTDANIGITLNTNAKNIVSYHSTDNVDNNETAYTQCVGTSFSRPTITITAPGNSFSGLSVTFSFSGNDSIDHCSVSRYWVKMDSGDWQDNARTASYTYTIDPGETLPATHTFYVKTTVSSDQNSLYASKIVTFTSMTGGTIVVGPAETLPQAAITGETPKEPVVAPRIVEQQVFNYSRAIPLLVELVFPAELASEPGLSWNRRFATTKELSVAETIESYSVTFKDLVLAYNNRISIIIENKSNKRIKGINLVQVLDKSVLASAKKIHSDNKMEIVNDDPTVLFFVDEIKPGKKVEIVYDFNSQKPLNNSLVGGIKQPIVLINLQPEDGCFGIKCNDFNPCTVDYCDEKCVFVPLPDGTPCAQNAVCSENRCTIPGSEASGLSQILILMTRYDFLILGWIALTLMAGTYLQVMGNKWKKAKGGQ